MQKYKHLFDTTHLQSDLKKKSLRSGAVTLGSQGLQFVIQLGSTMILARILTPADYGINGMAVAITGFANVFSNLGLSTATVQRAEINHEQVSTLFWINACMGLVLTLLVAACSPLIAWFYKQPEMFSVMLALSSMFILNGLAVQHSALLTRQMRFLELAIINVSALFGGIMVAIVAAKNGFGYWSLIFNSLAYVTMNSLGLWLVCRWIPGLPRRDVGVKSMVKFGSDLMAFDIVNYFARNLDNILIGRYWGAGQLGLYSKAYQLLMMPITNLRNPITNVAMPSLSRLQHEPEQYRDYYLKLVSLLAFVSMPMVAFMFVASDQLILLFLGDQWTEVSVIFQVLAVAAFFQPVGSTTGLVLITTGRSRKYLVIGCLAGLVNCLSFIIGLKWGAIGVATAYTVGGYLFMIPFMMSVYKDTLISVKSFFKCVSRPLFSSVLSSIVTHFFIQNFDFENMFLTILLSFIVYAILFVIFFVMLRGYSDLKNYNDYIRIILDNK